MIKGKLEAKLTLNIEMTDGMMKAIETTPEELKEMIENGSIIEVFQKGFNESPIMRLLGGCTIEQISVEVHEV